MSQTIVNPISTDLIDELQERRRNFLCTCEDGTFNYETDNKNTLNDWAVFVGHQVHAAVQTRSAGMNAHVTFRDQMLSAAALAIAAVEAVDRNGDGFAKRHYD